jgi:hypothetical protein
VNFGYEEDDQKMPKTDHTLAAAILAKEIYPTYLLSLVLNWKGLRSNSIMKR